ncbi:MAG: simple sugar transport system substrate-binding protein [Halanaerobiales bacterium]|nr:simple sugar transport system substrate-binding protein [Halanaerobiales bacterium]
MKKAVLLAVLFCLALGLFAATAWAKDWKIATVVKDSTNPWFIRMEEGVKEFAADTGINAFQKGPNKCDVALQVQVIEDLIAQGVDALCVVPISPPALEPVLKKAMDKGIVVVTHEASNQRNTYYDIEAFDNNAYGAFIMDNLAKAMNYEGKYVTMVAYLTSRTHNEWAEAGIARQKEKYPNMELIPEEKVESEDNQETAYERAKELMKKYPDLKGIMGTSSNDAPGAAKAIEEMGKKGKVFTAGSSIVPVAEKFLENGTLDTITFWDPAKAAYAMNVLAKMILEGREDEIKTGLNLGVEGYENMTLKGKVLVGSGWIAVTKENMAEYDWF